MTSDISNVILMDIERMRNNGGSSTFTQAQLNAMIQLQICSINANNGNPSSTDLQAYAAAVNNVMAQLFPGGTLPAGSSMDTTMLFTSLTTVQTGDTYSVAEAAASTNPAAELADAKNGISDLSANSLTSGSSTFWFTDKPGFQSGVPAYTPDTDTNLQEDLNAYMSQISSIESILFPSGAAPLSPTNNPTLFLSEMKGLAGLLSTISNEAKSDSTNGYSNAISALFNQTFTLPGTSTSTTLGTLLSNLTSPPSGETPAQAATALQEALYGSPPAPGNGEGISGTLYAQFNQALSNAWGTGPG